MDYLERVIPETFFTYSVFNPNEIRNDSIPFNRLQYFATSSS